MKLSQILKRPLAATFAFPPFLQEKRLLNSLEIDFKDQCEQMVYQSHTQAGDLLLSLPQRGQLSEMFEIRQEILKVLQTNWPLANN